MLADLSAARCCWFGLALSVLVCVSVVTVCGWRYRGAGGAGWPPALARSVRDLRSPARSPWFPRQAVRGLPGCTGGWVTLTPGGGLGYALAMVSFCSRALRTTFQPMRQVARIATAS